MFSEATLAAAQWVGPGYEMGVRRAVSWSLVPAERNTLSLQFRQENTTPAYLHQVLK